MIRHVITRTGTQFVYDTQTVSTENGIIRSNFVLLRAEKLIRMASKKQTGEKYVSVSYEYTSELFSNLPMCSTTEVINDEPADETLTSLYERIFQHRKLGPELQKLLRDHYLQIIDLRDNEEG